MSTAQTVSTGPGRSGEEFKACMLPKARRSVNHEVGFGALSDRRYRLMTLTTSRRAESHRLKAVWLATSSPPSSLPAGFGFETRAPDLRGGAGDVAGGARRIRCH